MRTRASTPVYQSVSRTRTELNICALILRWSAQLVACSASGVDKRHAEWLINLSAQTINVDFYEFRERVERIVPDVFGDFFASDNLAGVTREVFKQCVLFGGEFDGTPIALDSLPARIYLKIADLNDGWPQLLPAPQQCTQSRQKFSELERFRQIVVCAGIQSTDAILHCISRREHENRDPRPLRAQFAANLEAVALWDHHVENDRI